MPWYAKTLAVCLVAYALSPIDLIPDPIPVLGYMDDLVLLPLGILLVVRMVPPDVMAKCRERARAGGQPSPQGRSVATALIVMMWLLVMATGARIVWRWLGS